MSNSVTVNKQDVNRFANVFLKNLFPNQETKFDDCTLPLQFQIVSLYLSSLDIRCTAKDWEPSKYKVVGFAVTTNPATMRVLYQ